MNHTPTPYKLVEYADTHGLTNWSVCGDGMEITKITAHFDHAHLNEEKAANAAFIVRAVNSHEELKSKLDELIRSVNNVTGLVRAQMTISSNLQEQHLSGLEFEAKRAREYLDAIAKAESKS